MELSQLPLVLLLISNIYSQHTKDTPQPVLSVSPQKWLTEGDPVTLICEVYGSSTGWTFSWFTVTASTGKYHYQLLSDSSRGAGGNYTVSSAALKHTGVYVCTAERRKPAYKTIYSNTQPLWVTGVSPPVSLIISPSRTQHFTSVSLSLSCEDQSNSDRWTVRRYKDRGWLDDCSSSLLGSQSGSTCTISTITLDTGVYWCQSESGKNSHPVNITVHSGVILESPVHPVTEGDTLTLHCLYQHSTPPNLRADFYKDGSLIQSQTTEMIISTVSKSHEGFYYCKHPYGESPKSWISVRDKVQAGLSVSPQKWLTEGDPVTLICEVYGSSTGWTFSWFTVTASTDSSDHYQLLSDSSRGAGGNYTVSSAALKHTGVYVCRAERVKTAYNTTYSNKQPLWVTGVSPPVSLIISPSRTQHFTSVSLSLSCEDQSNSDRWTVRRYTDSEQLEDCSSSVWGSQTGSTCTISSTSTSDTGVYWCQSESGENSNPVNITVHSSRSDGLNLMIIGVTAGLTVTFLIIVFLVLLCCYRNNKGVRSRSPSSVSQQQNSSQTSEQNQSDAGNNTLLSGTDHIYDNVDATNNKDISTDSASGPAEVTYAEIELKSKEKQKKKKENKGKTSEGSDTVYSKLNLVTHQGAGSNDVTYAQVQ
ncbi:Fc receptor-like protein 4 [Labeo rohita]|uniref:Fc receptor-like protein 4 n=1 Tax=Labeo rohita TaxID=84645 RepID=UPI0021E2E66A|nr:Fc receptor-like protein 4 [Labeo rohita]